MTKANKNKYDMSKMRVKNIKSSVNEYMENAEKYYKEKNFEKALENYLKLYDFYIKCDYPKADDILLEHTLNHVCLCYKHLERYDDCIKFCEKAPKTDMTYCRAVENLFYCYGMLKNEDKMIEYLELLSKIEPENSHLINADIETFIEENKIKEACEYLDKVKQRDNILQITFYELIQNINDENLIDYKINFCKEYANKVKRLKIETQAEYYGEILDELIYYYFKINDYEKVIEYYFELKQLHDKYFKDFKSEKNYQYLDFLGKFAVISFIKLKKYDEGINIFLDLIKQGFGYYGIYLLLSVLYYFNKNEDGMSYYCEKALESNELSSKMMIGIIKNSKIFDFEKTKQYIWEFTNENEEFFQFYDEIIKLKFDESFFQNIILKFLEFSEI